MKLIFVNRYFHPDISATSQMLSSLAFHLAAAGCEVHVVTSRQRYDDPMAGFAPSEVVSGVHVHRVRTSRFGRPNLRGRALDYLTFYFAATFTLLMITRRADVIVAKTDPPLISVPAAIVARLRGARLVNWLQDLFPELAEHLGVRIGRVAGLARIARNYSLRNADFNVVVGEQMRRKVESLQREARVRVIHNWADGTMIVPVDKGASAMRETWGLAGKFVVAYSGNLGRAHEFDTILEAATLLRDDSRIVFLVIGGGYRVGGLATGAQVRGLSNVIFRAYQPPKNLCASLGAADLHLITLLPSLEGLLVPSKVYGILAAGRPALNVGDPAGEVAAILADAQAGMTIPTGDATLLAKTIVQLASSPERTAELGMNARRSFDQRYSQHVAFERWSQLLREAGLNVAH
ncbi:MAG: glycosyltransferase family 4 protein [Betaproteobacteria bacterium]